MARRGQVEYLLREIGLLQREVEVLTKERDMARQAKQLTDEFADWAGVLTPENLRQWATERVAREQEEKVAIAPSNLTEPEA